MRHADAGDLTMCVLRPPGEDGQLGIAAFRLLCHADRKVAEALAIVMTALAPSSEALWKTELERAPVSSWEWGESDGQDTADQIAGMIEGMR